MALSLVSTSAVPPAPHLERVRPWNYFWEFGPVAVPDVAFVAIVRLTCLYSNCRCRLLGGAVMCTCLRFSATFCS
jgi:hypothetical protein